jgi:hypothetical protein
MSPPRWELLDGRNRIRCEIYPQRDGGHTWHTFDDLGTGGENDTCGSLDDAKRHAVASIVLQGWAPGGWKVRWK